MIMKTSKMSLANIQGRLSRQEMKKIMAGSYTIQWLKCCGSNTQHFGLFISSCCYIPYTMWPGGSGNIECC